MIGFIVAVVVLTIIGLAIFAIILAIMGRAMGEIAKDMWDIEW